MLTLLLGRDWTANRNEILARIDADVREKKGNRIFMVPELISHDTERRLAQSAGDTSSRFVQVLSFTRLGRRVCDIVGSAAEETLDNGGRIVAMAAATRQLHNKLKAYAAVETKPEFLQDLVDAVDEFKRCCISPEDLMVASGKTEGGLAQKLEELSLILQAYDGICQQGKRDPRSQMTWVLEQLEDIDFAQNHVFYIDGFPDFTRQHMAILAHFIQHSPEVTVSLNCDQPDSSDPAFETAGRTARELLQIAEKLEVPVRVVMVQERQDALVPVRKRLFRGPVEQIPGLEAHLQAFRANNIYQECQAAAEEIIAVLRQGGRYRDVAVVCTDPAGYFPVLRLVFGKYQIPAYISQTENMADFSAMATVMFALDAALNGFERQRVLRYLRSVLSPLTPEQADKIENYAVIWGISGQQWCKEWQMHPKGLSAEWNDDSRGALAELNALRSLAIEPLQILRKNMQDAVQLKDMVLALYDFLEAVSFAERLDALAQSMDLSGDNRSAQSLNQIWEILLGALEQLHDVLGNTAWEADSFFRLLKLLIGQYDVGTIPTVLDSVTVGPLNAMRCQQQKYLVILGAEEGNLPGYAGSTGLLTDQERERLRSLGVPLTGGAMDGLMEEFSEIYGVICGAEEHISVYSSSNQPSFIHHRMAVLSGGEQMVQLEYAIPPADPDAASLLLHRWEAGAAAEQMGIAESYRNIVERKDYSMGRITSENVRGIYGSGLRLSASQVDRQAECRMSYFLKYGLRAQERKEATVDPAEFGTYIHAVLEETAREVMRRGGFHAVDLETTLEIANGYSQAYTREHFAQLDSQRMEYLFRRNVEELEMVVRELWRELHNAKYEPAYFELQFDKDGQMPAITIPSRTMLAQLRGFVDRVDVFRQENCSFVRVVDYKTGKKEFDYCDVFNGVGLQMLLYLFALEDAGQSLIEGDRVSAGVQYFPARAPYMSVDGNLSAEEAEKERKKLWKRSGLLLSNTDSLEAMDPSEKMDSLCCNRKKDGTISGDVADRVQLGLLKDYVMQLLGKMVDEIASGKVDPNPYTRGTSHNACSFCPYGAVCREDAEQGRRNYKTMAAEYFWEQVGKEVDHG